MLPLCMGTLVAQKTEADPCCEIVGIDANKNIVTVINNETGRVQQFKPAAKNRDSLRTGDRIALQNGKITSVNGVGKIFQPFEPINEFEPVNEFSMQVNGFEPVNTFAIVSLQVKDSVTCCGIVTVKNITTGQLHTFQASAAIARTFALGQGVNINNNLAVMQSGAGATPAQKGVYAFKINDSVAVASNKMSGENDSEKWVITPSGARGATGNVTVNFPTGTTWNMLFKTTENRHLISVNNAKSHAMVPGQYNIDFSAVPVLAVPVQKGMNTRLKAGTLNVVSEGGFMLYDENQKINYVSYGTPMKLGLPAGKYSIKISGQFQQVEIKDGQVTDF